MSWLEGRGVSPVANAASEVPLDGKTEAGDVGFWALEVDSGNSARMLSLRRTAGLMEAL